MIKNEELETAKGYLIGNLSVNMETTYDWAKWYGEQILYSFSKAINPEEMISKIKDIDAEKIREVSLKYFTSEKLCLSLIGDIKNKDIQVV